VVGAWEACDPPCLVGHWVGLLAKLLGKKSGIGLTPSLDKYVFRMEGFGERHCIGPGVRAPLAPPKSGSAKKPCSRRHDKYKLRIHSAKTYITTVLNQNLDATSETDLVVGNSKSSHVMLLL